MADDVHEGACYWAVDTAADRAVADSVVGTAAAGADGAAEGRTPSPSVPFDDEALASLERAGLVPALEVLGGDSALCLVPVSQTLADALATPFADASRDELLDAFVRLAETLGQAHARGLVHRAVQAERVVLGPEGEVVLRGWDVAATPSALEDRDLADVDLAEVDLANDAAFDAFLARYRDAKDLRVVARELGSPAFLPPETIGGEGTKADAHADVYALGAILYRLLTGWEPFAAQTFAELGRKVAQGEPIPAEKITDGVPSELSDLAARCLRRDPAERPTDGALVAETVRRWQEECRAEEEAAAARAALRADVEAAKAFGGQAAVDQLEQALVACRALVDRRPANAEASVLLAEATTLRDSFQADQDRARTELEGARGEAVEATKARDRAVAAAAEAARGRRAWRTALVGLVLAALAIGVAVFFSATGGARERMPDVNGMAEGDALHLLATKGLRGTVRREPVDRAEDDGRVRRTVPLRGAELPASRRVELVVGRRARRPAPLPDVVGSSEAEAAETLVAAGHEVVVHYRDAARSGDVGRVLAQSPPARAGVAPGTRIEVWVGRAAGPAEPTPHRLPREPAAPTRPAEASPRPARPGPATPEPAVPHVTPDPVVPEVAIPEVTIPDSLVPERDGSFLVPDMRGWPIDRAEDLLREAGLIPISSVEPTAVPGFAGRVIRQNPKAGESRQTASMVFLNVGATARPTLAAPGFQRAPPAPAPTSTGTAHRTDVWVEVAAPTRVHVGQPFVVAARVTNTGDVALEDLVFSMRRGAPLRSVGTAALRLEVPRLGVGASESLRGTFVADVEGAWQVSAHARDPRAWAAATDGATIRVGPSDDGGEAGPAPEMYAQDLSLTLSTPASARLVGGAFGVTARVVNTGRTKLFNVALAISGSNGLTVEGEASERRRATLIPELEPGAEHELEAVLEAREAGTFRVLASAREEHGQAAAGAYAELVVEGLPALQLAMIDVDREGKRAGVFSVGDEFLYVLQVQNDGGVSSTPEAKVVWAFPPELEFVSGGGDHDVTVAGAGQEAASSSFVLAPGEVQRFEIVVRATKAPLHRLVQSRATVETTSGTQLVAETESTTVVPAGSDDAMPALQLEMIDLSVDHEDLGVFREGERFLYALEISNTGGTAGTPDLCVVWALPPELRFVSGAADRDVQVLGEGQSAECSTFHLDPGDAQHLEIVVECVKAPSRPLVQVRASVLTTDKRTEVATETESTTLRPR